MKNNELNKLIEEISTKEKERHNISFSLETPTVIEYYKENIKKNYSLHHKLNIIIGGYKAGGIAFFSKKKIIVFDKDFSLHHMIKHPIEHIQSNLNNKVIIALITLHEIRHIIQRHKKNEFNNYEEFCIKCLKILNSKYKFNKELHDSQYDEIDANLYACTEAEKYIDLDEKQKKFIEKTKNECLFKKNSFDFEMFFNFFCDNYIETMSKRIPNIIEVFWNEDNTFKRPKEIMNDPRFLLKNSLSVKILSSNAYLSSLVDKDLTDDEFVFINYEIQLNKKDIEDRIIKNNNLYENKQISKEDHIKADNYLKNLLVEKDKYLEIITENNTNNYRSKRK